MSDKLSSNRRPPLPGEMTCKECRARIKAGLISKGEPPIVVYDFGAHHKVITLCGPHYLRQKEDYEPLLPDLLKELKNG